MSRGFCSERTAEYILVPRLLLELEQLAKHRTAIYFWVSREGTGVARTGLRDRTVRVVAAFARRPKVDRPGQPWVDVKFNDILFAHTDLLAAAGVPVVAGVPCVTSLADLSMDAPCAWFRLKAGQSPHCDEVVRLRLPPMPRYDHDAKSGVMGPLDGETLRRIVLENARPLDWEAALDVIVDAHRERGRMFGQQVTPWGARSIGYKPVYAFLFD